MKQGGCILFYYFRDDLRLKSKNVLYPPNLYKGMVWMEGGNDKLFYAGVQVRHYYFLLKSVMSRLYSIPRKNNNQCSL